MSQIRIEEGFPRHRSVVENINLLGGEIKIKLLAPQDVIFPLFTGSIIRASFLHFIAENDSLLADELHRDYSIRPYSISQIKTNDKKQDKSNRSEIRIRRGEIFSFSIRLLNPQLLEKTVRIFVNNANPCFYLLNQEYNVSSFECKKLSFDLKKQGFMVKIFFNTPTYFSSLYSSHPVLFPETKYLFMNIAKNWNQFHSNCAKIPLELLKKWLEENVVINDYKMSTRRVYLGKRNPILGFKGWIVYRFLKQDNIFGWIGILCEYAKITNVGGNRTAGMGEIEVKWIENKRKNTNNSSKLNEMV